MPANHCVPHTPEARAKISAKHLGIPLPHKRRPSKVVGGVEYFRCSTCAEFKARDCFYRNKRTLLGLTSECKTCHTATSLRTRNKDNAREIRRVVEMNRRARLAGCDGKVTRSQIRMVLAVFESKCARCGSEESVEIDHVVPLSVRGQNAPTNFQCLCSGCNDHKHARYADYLTREQTVALSVIEFKRL